MKYILIFFVVFNLSCKTRFDSNNYNFLEKKTKSVLLDFLNSKDILDIEKYSNYMHPIGWQISLKRNPKNIDVNGVKKNLEKLYNSESAQNFKKNYKTKFNIKPVIDTILINNEIIFIFEYEQISENRLDLRYDYWKILAFFNYEKQDFHFIKIDDKLIDFTQNIISKNFNKRVADKINSNIKVRKINNVQNKFVATTEVENKLHKQFMKYFKHLSNNELEEAYNYIYPNVKRFFKNKYKSKFQMEKIIEFHRKENEKIDFKNFRFIGILNKVATGSNLIYVINYNIITGSGNHYFIAGGEAFAISEDMGENWTFFEKLDEDYKEILSYNYNEDIILKIDNYIYSNR